MMKKSIWLTLFFIILWASLAANYVLAINEDKEGYLIISNNICIIVKSPAKQFTSSVGLADLGIILKDKVTRITINGGYLAIAMPLTKIAETIKKYHLQNLTMIE